MKQKVLFKAISVLLGVVFLAFQLEVFDAEYEANHATRAETLAFAKLSLNWETFDKENASKAFTFDAGLCMESLFELELPLPAFLIYYRPYHPIRDKSPPAIHHLTLPCSGVYFG